MIKSHPFKKLADVSSEYVYDHNGKNLTEMWESRAFGGSVYNKIARKHGGYVTNYLKEKVENLNIAYTFGGGYY